jgi:hypothetical protein
MYYDGLKKIARSLPYQTLFVKPSYQVYNKDMAPHHFAKMYQNPSHRHDAEHDSYGFEQAVGALCGMLYSVVTLKAFFPKSPALEINDNPVKDAAGGDQKYEQLPLW